MYKMVVNGKDVRNLDISEINEMDLEGEVWDLELVEENYKRWDGKCDDGEVSFIWVGV